MHILLLCLYIIPCYISAAESIDNTTILTDASIPQDLTTQIEQSARSEFIPLHPSSTGRRLQGSNNSIQGITLTQIIQFVWKNRNILLNMCNSITSDASIDNIARWSKQLTYIVMNELLYNQTGVTVEAIQMILENFKIALEAFYKYITSNILSSSAITELIKQTKENLGLQAAV